MLVSRSAAGLMLLVLVVVGGCRTTAATIEPDGQPLEVRVRTFEHKAFWSTDNEFIPAGTASIFEGYYQGEQSLEDEVNFYHVAGDAEREAKVIEHHQKYNNSLVATWVLNGAAVALLGTGAVLISTGGVDDIGAYTQTTPGQIAVGLLIAGGALGAASFLAADAIFGPAERLHVEGDYEILYDLETANMVEEEYNQRLTTGTAAPTPEPSPDAT